MKNTKEEVYAEWDEEFECYGIFGLDSGHCYQQYYRKEEAEQEAREVNERGGKIIPVNPCRYKD